MTLDLFEFYCMSKPGVAETYPHGNESVWYKVMGKSFAWTFVKPFKFNGKLTNPFHFINLKCDEHRAIDLRNNHESIAPGWHQNKKYWNTIFMNKQVPEKVILELIDHSYDQVVSGLSKKAQKELEQLDHEK